jgi:hypothetical protein
VADFVFGIHAVAIPVDVGGEIAAYLRRHVSAEGRLHQRAAPGEIVAKAAGINFPSDKGAPEIFEGEVVFKIQKAVLVDAAEIPPPPRIEGSFEIFPRFGFPLWHGKTSISSSIKTGHASIQLGDWRPESSQSQCLPLF